MFVTHKWTLYSQKVSRHEICQCQVLQVDFIANFLIWEGGLIIIASLFDYECAILEAGGGVTVIGMMTSHIWILIVKILIA